MRENRLHGSEGGEDLSPSRPLSAFFVEGAQEAKRQRSECDDPRVALGPAVLSESAALVQAETKQKVSRQGVQSLWEPWRSASRRDGRSRGGRRTARAAEGKACRQFLAPFGDLDVPKGIAKNGDTIVADLPMDAEPASEGHHTPADFDRRH